MEASNEGPDFLAYLRDRAMGEALNRERIADVMKPALASGGDIARIERGTAAEAMPSCRTVGGNNASPGSVRTHHLVKTHAPYGARLVVVCCARGWRA